jgi:pyruvate/2-oxoglutarate dehydrogenase complex dihydrolipoamide dehydrogenase (E3) component
MILMHIVPFTLEKRRFFSSTRERRTNFFPKELKMQQNSNSKIIVVGGGLAGLSACHTILERGGNVLLLDKNAFLGGNSTKATSGINGAGTSTQIKLGIPDNSQIFYEDTAKSARAEIQPELVKVLTHQSGSAVEWIQEKFKVDLSLVSRLGGHSQPRTHRGMYPVLTLGTEQFPGMTITYALMSSYDDACKRTPTKAALISKATVTGLIKVCKSLS